MLGFIKDSRMIKARAWRDWVRSGGVGVGEQRQAGKPTGVEGQDSQTSAGSESPQGLLNPCRVSDSVSCSED